MPNYVINKIFIQARPETAQAIINAVCNEKGEMDFEKIIPMPDYIFRGDLGQKEREKYGKNNWYDWSVENWDTKWNAWDSYSTNRHIVFCTAWSAPTKVIRQLSEMYPKVRFVHSWADEDLGYNLGSVTYKNGVVVKDSDILNPRLFAIKMWNLWK